MKNKIVIVISEFNKKISDNLLDGATSEYIKNGGDSKVDIFIIGDGYKNEENFVNEVLVQN